MSNTQEDTPPIYEQDLALVADEKQSLHRAWSKRISYTLAAIETGMIILGPLLIFLVVQRRTGGDGAWRYKDLIALWNHHKPTSVYSIIGPFFSLPLYLIGKKLGHPEEWICAYNEILFASGLLILYFLLRNHIDRRLLRIFLLLLIGASMFGAQIPLFYGEVFTALCVSIGVVVAVTRTGIIVPIGWLAVMLGAANTPASLVGLGLVVLKRTVDRRRLRYILVLLIASGLVLGESWVRRGSPFTNGYEGNAGMKTVMPYSGLPGFSYPFFFGLLSILFSFGKGLLFFTPGLLLPIRKTLQQYRLRDRVDLFQIYVLWLCFLVGLILVYARWWAWYGGLFWGPRFFLIGSLAAAFALAVRLRYAREAPLLLNLVTLIVFCLSVWVGIDGTVYYQYVVAPPVCINNNFALEALCHYTPEMSVLWLPFVRYFHLQPAQILLVGYFLIVALYLAFPLLKRVAQQLWELGKSYGRTYLDLKTWGV